MMLNYTFIILLNLTSGEQVEVFSQPMPQAACLQAQASIWSIESPVVAESEAGQVLALDAACVPS
jgi:hypothetical protein